MEIVLLFVVIGFLFYNSHQNNFIMSAISDLKDKVAAQSTALETVSTNVDGIKKDVTFLKDKLAGLEGGATAEEIAEVSTLVDDVSTKIDAIGAATATLDSETDSSGTPPV